METDDINSNSNRAQKLWALAKRRVAFKYHLIAYVIVNSFFWLLWFSVTPEEIRSALAPWSIWPMTGWGIGLVFHFVSVFVLPGNISTEKEHEKLIKNGK